MLRCFCVELCRGGLQRVRASESPGLLNIFLACCTHVGRSIVLLLLLTKPGIFGEQNQGWEEGIVTTYDNTGV